MILHINRFTCLHVNIYTNMDGFETGSVSYCHLLGSLCCILRCFKKSLKRRAAKAREEEGNGTNLHFNKYKHVNIIMLTFWIRERKFMITVGLQLLILADAFLSGIVRFG